MARPKLMPVYPVPDVHRAPPMVDAETLTQKSRDPAYAAGYCAGCRFAVDCATFDELDHLATGARTCNLTSPWLRGWFDAVTEFWAEMNNTVLTTA